MKTIIGATLLALTVSLTPQTQLTPEIEQPLERKSTKATVIEQGDFKPVALASAKVVRSEPEKPTQGTQTSNASGLIQGECSTKQGKEYIYCKESRGNPAAINAGGCRGLGQACPGSKLPCSDSDYSCQDKWFTNYMLNRYRSWNAAVAFHKAHNWW
jgi:hypothetical protein